MVIQLGLFDTGNHPISIVSVEVTVIVKLPPAVGTVRVSTGTSVTVENSSVGTLLMRTTTARLAMPATGYVSLRDCTKPKKLRVRRAISVLISRHLVVVRFWNKFSRPN